MCRVDCSLGALMEKDWVSREKPLPTRAGTLLHGQWVHLTNGVEASVL